MFKVTLLLIVSLILLSFVEADDKVVDEKYWLKREQ